MADQLTGEVTELLQQLIRNQCVNDGSPESGEEARSADLLRDYLEGTGMDMGSFDSLPGRRSLVARIEGSDPNAPSLCLMGHTDVVPVTPSGWSRDPFGGELVDGEVWGRGAIDMLNLTASMAVATKHLARSGFRPKGTLLYFAVADEEAGGHWGAEWALDHEPDAVAADYVITESGGLVMDTQAGQKVTITVAEKGVMWRRLRVRGTPGHGSAPFGADNALVKAAEVVRRIAAYEPRAQILDLWENYVDAFDLTDAQRKALRDPDTVLEACRTLPDQGIAKLAHACTHTTFSPNVAHGGVKTNVIPDVVDLDIDIRVMPGETNEDVRAHIDAALGDLSSEVELSIIQAGEYTRSPTDTPLYSALEKVAQRVYPDATLMPVMTVGGTDARFYRNAGSLAYGFGLMSPDVTYQKFRSRFHGNDERVDVESLRLTTDCWLAIVEDVLG